MLRCGRASFSGMRYKEMTRLGRFPTERGVIFVSFFIDHCLNAITTVTIIEEKFLFQICDFIFTVNSS